MSSFPACPRCKSDLTYEDAQMYICPECAHEWAKGAVAESADTGPVVRDANGNELRDGDTLDFQILDDGDTVTVIKDLKVKGASSVLKVGTKVKSIRLVEGDHNIDCNIDGFGAMKLKSEFVKKAG
jgi:protein PhnA